MSQTDIADVTEAQPRPFGLNLRSWVEWCKLCLYPYHPRFRDRRFWVVLGLVVAIALLHFTVEAFETWGWSPSLAESLSFVPISMFFIPVLYSALNFNYVGAVATAVLCTVLVIPNTIVFHEGMGQIAEFVQIGIVDAVAVFVGQRIDREVGARERAESAEIALKASEKKYRLLFERSPVAVIVLDPAATILDANPQGGIIFDTTTDAIRGATMADLVGPASTEKLLDPYQDNKWRVDYLYINRGGSEIWLEPNVTRLTDDQGKSVIQVILRDVTLERQRQAGLRAYAANVLRAQEEERKRISHELHDDFVQLLVLLCRRLDAVESAGDSFSHTAIEGLKEARGTAERVVQGLRDFAKSLRPPTLDDLGLVTSIRRLITDLAEGANVDGQLKVAGKEIRLPPDTELGVFRIIQEALRNVERHAHATHMTVRMTFDKDRLKVDVIDDGKGFLWFEQANFTTNGQLGLVGMQERAGLLGGKLDIQSTLGQGTRVNLSIPVNRQAP